MIKDVVVTFRLTRDDADRLDECASSVNMSRSAFLVWLFETALPLIPVVSAAMKKPLENAIRKKGADLED